MSSFGSALGLNIIVALTKSRSSAMSPPGPLSSDAARNRRELTNETKVGRWVSLTASLLEDSFDTMLKKEVNIRPDDKVIWKWGQVAAEIRLVIPYVCTLRDFCPVSHILLKRCI